MSKKGKVRRNAWKRRAEELQSEIREANELHRRGYRGIPTVQFALVQDFGMRRKEHISTLLNSTLDRAGSELTLNKVALPSSTAWGCLIEGRTRRMRFFLTNLPKGNTDESVCSKLEEHLSQSLMRVTQLFLKGDKLLESIPFELPKWESCIGDLRPLKSMNVIGLRWLSTLFDASWNEAHPFGLLSNRFVCQTRKHEGMQKARYEDCSSKKVFFCISVDVLEDSACLIDWLLSQLEDRSTAQAKDLPRSSSLQISRHKDEGVVYFRDRSGNVRRLRPCDQRAWLQFKDAEVNGVNVKTDREAFDWYRTQRLDVDETLPEFSTWARYLRNYRAATNTTNKTFALTKPTRSMVRRSEDDRRGAREN